MAAITDCEHLVQYYETDQMGVTHHSNYIRWFEEARTKLFEDIGLGYKGMEELGIISPVVGLTAKYKTMAKYCDTVVIRAEIKAVQLILFLRSRADNQNRGVGGFAEL